MIKFKALVHKETGTIIAYENWEWCSMKNKGISITQNNYAPKGDKSWSYEAKEMLFSDDFIIVYDSEFTTEELEKLYIYNNDLDLQIEFKIKINELIGEREYIKNKYGIEI